MASVDMHDIDLKEFNEVLAACKGDVFMVTPEGDRLNLKSWLCQLIGFTKLIEGGSIAEAKLECSDPEEMCIRDSASTSPSTRPISTLTNANSSV